MGQTEMRVDDCDTNASTTSTSGMVAPYQTALGAVIIPPSKPGLTVIENASTTGDVFSSARHAQAPGIFSKGRSNHFLPARSTRASPYDKPLPYCPNSLAATLVAGPSPRSTTRASNCGSGRRSERLLQMKI